MELPSVGDVFEARYELVDVLGEGGFAKVFLAADHAMSRDVVIKVLSPRDGDYSEALTARFMREARVFAELQDPHTITMFDFGASSDGLLYMVFEHVRGRELRELIGRRRPLEPDVVAHVLAQLLSALREAHAAGILHRDLKPANILVFEYAGDPYRVKLLDFGIAKDITPGAAKITQTGHVIGTPRYMSPEQFVGEPCGPDSDLFSLGLVTYEMLTGQPAFGGAGRELMQNLLSEKTLLVPTEVAPPELRAVVNRLIARDRAARYADASRALTDLRALPREPKDAPTPLAPTAANSSTPTKSRRSRWPYFVAALLTPLAALGVFVSLRPAPEPPLRTMINLPMAPAAPAAPRTEPSPDVGVDAPIERETGCGKQPPFVGQGQMSSGHFGHNWTAHIPRSYDPDQPHPLMLMFHRKLADGPLMLRDTQMGLTADEHGVVVFAFTATNGVRWTETEREIVLEAIEHARSKLCIDESRLYAIGDEIGAPAAWELACEIPISAYAVTAVGAGRSCQPIVPTARMRLYGRRDKNIRVQGGWGCNPFTGRFAASAHIDRAWQQVYGCTGPSKPWGKFAGGSCETWDCARGPFVSCGTSAGHYWPGSAKPLHESPACRVEPSKNPFPYREAIWQFFEDEGYVIDQQGD